MKRMKLTPQHHVLYLLYRPTEPCFVPKGRMRLVFDVLNNDFLAPQFHHARSELEERFYKQDTILVPLKAINFPNLSLAMNVGREEVFSTFLPHHQRAAGKLLGEFMSAPEYEDFLSIAVYARDRVNPMMFVHTYCAAVIHRPDTRGVLLPPLHSFFPDRFLDGGHIAMVREHADVLTAGEPLEDHKPICFPKDYSASDLDPEHRLAYFREDIGINLHHWHWHLVYPYSGPPHIVNKDRRGELFYYMHRQIIARYDFERLCNRLARSERLLDLRKKIPEGYFPKLYCTIAGKTWPSRSAGVKLSDVRREDLKFVFDIDDLERWKTRIIEAIHLRKVVDKEGKTVPLTEEGGIDILGDMVEASELLSKNSPYYGNLHNFGHVLIALCHDPDGRYKETVGVMGETMTAMRDPIFYRWHSYIDYVFEMHKNTLPPYRCSELAQDGIFIEEVSVYSRGEPCKNVLKTFWEEKDIELSGGLDFTDRMNIYARVIRLQHRTFSYSIKVRNKTKKLFEGTVRIFLAPKFDEKGQTMLLIDQKRLFAELDKFNVTLSPLPELNVLERSSEDSYVTVEEGPGFEEIEKSLADSGQADTTRSSKDDFCGCGWPKNMLLPKGSAEGFQCQLFIMISDAEKDQVDPSNQSKSCLSASSYCGALDAKYPDRRAMGYPFDRPPSDIDETLENFVNALPNMAIQDVTIIFEDRIEPEPRGNASKCLPSN